MVAPTVNVSTSDNKSLNYKSILSTNNLTNFLNNEILNKYNFIFKQIKDDVGPIEIDNENGNENMIDLQLWIQKILNEMQKSIENHVNLAMDNANKSNNK